jgi:thiosulfate/3-mercaptopyruvate sulfurtransferase
MNVLVSIKWLEENKDDHDLILLDAGLQKKATATTSKVQSTTIPGSIFFDLKENFSDKNSLFPNTLPSEEDFQNECRKLGINQTSKIVVFDSMGIYSSPRVWWMFKVMGHDDISVLNGGLPEWVSKELPTEKSVFKTYSLGNFKAVMSKEFVKGYEDILDNISANSFTVIDARSEGRFNGTDAEPRKSLKSGHIENSVNIPFQTVLENGKYKSGAELKRIFEDENLDKKDLVFSCGSGLTACIVMLASDLAYKKSKYIYDGSWSEWAERQKLKTNID